MIIVSDLSQLSLKNPGFDVSEAVGESGWVSGRGDGFGGDLELDIVSITVEVEIMVGNDVAKGKHVVY